MTTGLIIQILFATIMVIIYGCLILSKLDKIEKKINKIIRRKE